MSKFLFSFIPYILISLTSCSQSSKHDQSDLDIKERLQQMTEEREHTNKIADYLNSLGKKEPDYSNRQTHENEESSNNEVTDKISIDPFEFIPKTQKDDKTNKIVKEIYEKLRKKNKHEYSARDSLFKEREKQIKKRQKKLDSLREELKNIGH